MAKPRIALAQIDTVVGDVEGNVARVLEAAAEAKAQGARIIALPELVVCGYPPRDLLNLKHFRRSCDEGVARIVRELPEGIVAIFGAPRARKSGQGRTLINAALVARRGELLAEMGKALLPTYDVFDERRYFEPADAHASRVVEVEGEKSAS